MVLYLVLLFAPGPAAVPPPVVQESANCVAPVYASDHLVCSDAALRRLDGRLVSAIAASPTVESSPWFEANGEWFRRRSLCAFLEQHRQCLIEAYTDRLAILARLVEPPQADAPASCGGQGQRTAVRIWLDPASDSLVLRDTSSKAVIGVASGRHQYQQWATALVFKKAGATFDFSRHDGSRFTCRVAAA